MVKCFALSSLGAMLVCSAALGQEVRVDATDVDRGAAPAQQLANGSTFLPVDESCTLPEPRDADRVVVVGAYEGRHYASVTVAGQARSTTHAYIDVEADRPVYLMLSSFEAMIWQIDGPVDRVVASVRRGHHGDGIGIIGVDPEDIAFLHHECPKAARFEVYRGGPAAVVAAQVAREALGLPRSDYAGSYTIARVVVGEESVEAHERLAGSPRRIPYFDSRPVDLDVSDVVSSAPAEDYLVLPGETGLRRLIESGAVAAAEASDFVAWMEGYLSRPDVDVTLLPEHADHEHIAGFYRVVSAEHLPAADPWWNEYVWLVPEGVADPSEPSGRQCIFLMDGYQFAGPEDCPAILATR